MGILILLPLLALCAFAQAGSAPTLKNTYVLGADDQVAVRVLDLEEFTEGTTGKDRVFRIDLRGNVNLPLIGRVKAGGLTVEQFEGQLVERLKEYLKRPSVTVTVAEYKSQPISVLGQVVTPGVHQLQGRKTLFEVISTAGGLKADAGYSIRITRRLEYGRVPLPTAKDDESGKYSVAQVSVKAVMNAEKPEENILIQPNDVISVPKAELVYVVGNVKRSGGFVLGEREKISALQALSLAEGLDKSAATRDAKILRRTADGEGREEIALDLARILKGKTPDVLLEKEDILFVPGSFKKNLGWRALEAAIGIGTGIAIYRQ